MRTEEENMCVAAENWERAVGIAVIIVKAETKITGLRESVAHAVRHTGNVEHEDQVLLKARAWHTARCVNFLKTRALRNCDRAP